MKKGIKVLLSLLSVACCVVLVFSHAPVTHAAGMMKLIIDDKTYTKVYNDMGSLALVHWAYDASEDKLKLENFGTEEKPQTPILAYPYSGSMTIELNGDNYITGTREMAMIIIGSVTFTGTGTLHIVCKDSYAVYSDYVVDITGGASLDIDALAGITAGKGFNVNTTGSVKIKSIGKSVYTYSDVRITKGTVELSGTNGIYSSAGNVYISGGETDVEITSTQKAIYLLGEENYVEWSANGVVTAGSTAPGSPITEYSDQKYFHASFSGLPRLNYPRKIYWDDTVIDSSGTTNPVGRWSAVENATGYTVKLYYYNDVTYQLVKTFTVTDALSCNFGGHFTEYGKYCFSVSAIGLSGKYLNSAESKKTTEFYRFSGEVESRFYITFPESDYFTIIPENGTTVAYYGENWSFQVEIDPAYTQSELIIHANGERVVMRKGKYTIDNITKNITITIADMNINRYTVTMPEHEAYTIYLLPDNSTNVSYGESCSFSVELADIYMQSNIVVTANDQVLTPKFGIIYTISNITQNFNVEISGLVRDSYDVTYKHINGQTITTQTVDHGYTATAPSGPNIATGLTFKGWFGEDGNEFDFSTPINQAVTLYARYEAEKQNGYYLISTLEQLIWLRDEVNFGNTGLNAKLCADIEMNSGKYLIVNGEIVFTNDAVVWEPIGGYDYEDEENYVKFYEGDFDGGGHTLSGFYIKHDKMNAKASSLGIFGIVSANGSVNNLNVANSYFDGYGDIGSVAGISYSPISNCNSSATLIGVEDVGGIAGEIQGDVTNCSFSGTVTVEQYTSSSSAAPIGGVNGGGIVGRITEKAIELENCTVNGKVSAYNNAGGLVGASDVSGIVINNCSTNAVINANNNAAGLLAFANGLAVTFNNCKNSSEVTAVLSAGGFFADCEATVTNGINSGAVTANSSNGGTASLAGGFGANGSLNIKRSINNGTVKCLTGSAAGFIAGGNINAEFCYNIGDITGSTFASGFAVKGENAVINQAHNYATVSAASADAFAGEFTALNIQFAYYCSELMSSTNGTAATVEWFSCGYVSLLLNRNNSNNFWAQGESYPVFSSDTLQGYRFPMEGDGSVADPYIIKNENELRLARILVNEENGWVTLNYKLGADITISNPQTANNFAPFGSITNVFEGSFDGDGHTISGINISFTGNDAALFGGLSGKVLNLTLSGCSFSGKINVAAFAAQSNGSIINCSLVNSTVSGYENVGGFVGHNFGNVSYCFNRSTVNGTVIVGGIAGLHEDGQVTSCFNYGTVTGVDSGNVKSTEVGGVVGKNFAEVSYSGNTGTVSADSFAGGVVGANYYKLIELYNGGNVAANEYFGAICSINEGEEEPQRCYYVSGTAAVDAFVVGTVQSPEQAYNGMTAYVMNDSGKKTRWAQEGSHPTVALPDGSDAVIYTVIFYSFDSPYYIAATKHGGCAVTPPAPQVESYNFLYWDTPFNNVTGNMSTIAVFDQNTKIIFMPTANVHTYEAEYFNVLCGFEPEDGVTVGWLDSQIANSSPIVYLNFYEDQEYGSEQRLFTGMSVNLCPEEGVMADTLYVVIFGDVNGDSYVNETDAFIINMVCNEMIDINELDFAQQLAADVNRDGAVDTLDFEHIQQYLLKNSSINQYPSDNA